MPRSAPKEENIIKVLSSNGYSFISLEKVNRYLMVNYVCDKGHNNISRWDHLRDGHKCSICSGNKKLEFRAIKSDIESSGYKLLAEEYINSKSLLDIECPKNHKYKVKWDNWQSGNRCPYCTNRVKKDLEFIKENFGLEGYRVISNDYIDNRTPIQCICPNEHIYDVTWSNWITHNSRCPKCSEVGTSKSEQIIVDYIKSICRFNIKTRVRDLIPPYEIDIYIPELKLAIEYCGLYWHSERMGKDRYYHLNKLDNCSKLGIRLITIFEDDLLYKQDLLFSKLNNIICNDNIVLYARRCVVKEITPTLSKTFCEENHLQGYGAGSSVKLGLFHDNELVSVMTFAKPSISKGSKAKEGVWELHRFCSKLNITVIGGASKLLKYFERNYAWKEIFSYADRRWSIGNLYEKIGFEFEKFTKPNYWYFKNDRKRLHRFGFRKNALDQNNKLTEYSIRVQQGYNRIWDCGNIKYIKFNN